MRLSIEDEVRESSTPVLVIAGIIDWSTLEQFRSALYHRLTGPQPSAVVDFSGMLSWSPQAQHVLATAALGARLHGGHLEVFGLNRIPRWQAKTSGRYDVLELFGQRGGARTAIHQSVLLHRNELGLRRYRRSPSLESDA